MLLLIPTFTAFSVTVFCKTCNKLQVETFLALVCMTQICFESLTTSVYWNSTVRKFTVYDLISFSLFK